MSVATFWGDEVIGVFVRRNNSQTRHHILDTTEKALLECDSKDLHVQLISSLANVGVQTIYYHFESREQLIAEAQSLAIMRLTEPMFSSLGSAETAIVESDSLLFVAAIEDTFFHMWSNGDEQKNTNMSQLLVDISSSPSFHRSILMELKGLRDRWVAVLEHARAAGWIDETCDPFCFVSVWWATWWGNAALVRSEVEVPSLESIRKLLLSTVGLEI